MFPLLADSIFARYGWEKDSMQWEEKEKPVGGRKVCAKGTESTFTGGFTKAQGWGVGGELFIALRITETGRIGE